MMTDIPGILATLLPLALGLVAGPWPIVAMMMILLTPRPIVNALSYLLAWMAGIFLVGLLVLLIPAMSDLSGPPTGTNAWFRISLGIFFILISLVFGRKMFKAQDPEHLPPWIERLNRVRPRHALFTGIFLSVINLKNSSMVAAGALEIVSTHMSFSHELLALSLFSLASSLGVLFPLVLFLAWREQTHRVFDALKIWLVRYGNHILFVVLLIFGIVVISRGISSLQEVSSGIFQSR